jgi:hypothetical protein
MMGGNDTSDNECRLQELERQLLAGVRSPKIELTLEEIHRKGLVTALKERISQLQRHG